MKDIKINTKDLTNLYAAGSWFMFSKTLIKVLDLEHAVVISFLLNCRADPEGWLFVPVAKIKADLGLSDNQQRRILQNLSSQNFIEQCKKGVPARRHVRIQIVNIHKALHAPKEEEAPKSKSKKEFTFGATSSKVTEFDKKATTYFIEKVLKANGRIKTVNYKKYLEHFRLLRAFDMKGNDSAETVIKDVLKFYGLRYKDPYIPRAVSAEAFRKKFEAIYDHMLRFEESDDNKGKHDGIEEETV